MFTKSAAKQIYYLILKDIMANMIIKMTKQPFWISFIWCHFRQIRHNESKKTVDK